MNNKKKKPATWGGPRSNAGGARKGAGRKPTGTMPLLVRPKKATVETMRKLARKEQITIGGLLDRTFAGEKPVVEEV